MNLDLVQNWEVWSPILLLAVEMSAQEGIQELALPPARCGWESARWGWESARWGRESAPLGRNNLEVVTAHERMPSSVQAGRGSCWYCLLCRRRHA